jgi:hypothetical protein
VTLTPTRSRPPTPTDPEALIREARRFQHRRWAGRAVVAAAVVSVAGLLLSSPHGGAPARSGPPAFRPGVPPAAHVVNGPSLGPATSFVLTGPGGVAVDAGDNVFLSDGNRLYEVDHATGQILVVAGTGVEGFSGDGGPATDAMLSFPGAVALAPDGDVYVDVGNRIRKISATTGIISTVAGDGSQGDTGDGGPGDRASLDLDDADSAGANGIGTPFAIGPTGILYIADGGSNEIRRVSPTTGIITTVAGTGRFGSSGDGGPATRATLCDPVGITVDRSSNLFITTGCGQVRQVSGTTGLISTVFRASTVRALAAEGTALDPIGLGMGADGRLLVVGSTSRRVLELTWPGDKVILAAGTGTQTTPTAGATAGDGGPATAATFGSVSAVTVDSHGILYVADFFNNAIRAIDPTTGVISLVAGEIPTSPAAGHCC